MMPEELLLKDEVYAAVGAGIAVHRELGWGFLEHVYPEAMGYELTDRGIPFQPQVTLRIRYKDRILEAKYTADFICYGKLLVELKAIDRLTGRDESQLLNYLKATGLQVGLLLNFGAHGKLEWNRLVLTRSGPIDPEETL